MTRYRVTREFDARIVQTYTIDMPDDFDPLDHYDLSETDQLICEEDIESEEFESVDDDNLTHDWELI